jgi:hypothetical protein
LKQARRAHGEDTSDEEEEEGREERPAIVADELDWYDLEREDHEASW